MERRDRILLEKVLSEIAVAQKMMDGCSLETFMGSEMLMRATSMTVINVGELVKTSRKRPVLPTHRSRGRPSPVFGTSRRINTRPSAWRTCMKR